MTEKDTQLWDAYQANSSLENRNRLVENYLPLLNRVVHRFTARRKIKFLYEDLFQASIPALIDCIQRFDHRGAFSTFVSIRLHGALQDELRKMDHLSRNHREIIHQFDKLTGPLEERAEKMGIEPDKLMLLLEARLAITSRINLQSSDMERGEHFFGEFFFSAPADDSHNLEEIVDACCQYLRPQTARIFRMYWLETDDGKRYTMKRIAQVVGVCESRVSQIMTETYQRLKENTTLHRMLNPTVS